MGSIKRQMVRERAQIEKLIMEQNIHIMRHGIESFLNLGNKKYP